jgi:hypothetical protein
LAAHDDELCAEDDGGEVGVGLGDSVVAEHPTVDMAIDPFDGDDDVRDAWDGHRASSSACTSLP